MHATSNNLHSHQYDVCTLENVVWTYDRSPCKLAGSMSQPTGSSVRGSRACKPRASVLRAFFKWRSGPAMRARPMSFHVNTRPARLPARYPNSDRKGNHPARRASLVFRTTLFPSALACYTPCKGKEYNTPDNMAVACRRTRRHNIVTTSEQRTLSRRCTSIRTSPSHKPTQAAPIEQRATNPTLLRNNKLKCEKPSYNV